MSSIDFGTQRVACAFAALLGAALIDASGSVAAADVDKRTAPAAGCMDARRIERVRVIEPGLLLVSAGDGRFQIGLMNDCSGLDPDAELRVVSRGGWVCGAGEEYVQTPAERCAIGSVTTLNDADYVAAARTHDRRRYGADDATVLQPMEVRESVRRGRGFRGDTEYCFTQRAIRAWGTDGDDVLVTTSARRAGGHRRYRVALARSCPELDWAQRVEFRSAIGSGLVCGHPGDAIHILPDVEPQAIEQPLDSGVVPRSQGAVGGRLATTSCPIAAVYADDTGERD